MIAGVQNIGRIQELRQRILFTFGMLAVYRVGAYIVTPGIDPEVVRNFFAQMQGTIFGLFTLFSGGALEQLSIFSLGIMPYISASIIFQLLTIVIPQLEELEEGRRAGPAADQPVHALCDDRSRAVPGRPARVAARERPVRRGRGHEPGLGLPDPVRAHAHHRHGVHHVARRADHRARDRQRDLA
jgi:hypothetical protein